MEEDYIVNNCDREKMGGGVFRNNENCVSPFSNLMKMLDLFSKIVLENSEKNTRFIFSYVY